MSENVSGHRIRAARNMMKPRLKQDELVARMQIEGIYISNQILSLIELNKRYVTDVELIAFAKVLNVSTSWLLEETDNPVRQDSKHIK